MDKNMRKHFLTIPKRFGPKVISDIQKGLAEIKSGNCHKIELKDTIEIREIRQRLKVGQQSFAELLGISVRTLQEWEQGRRKPTKAARSLLLIARDRPDVIVEMFSSKLFQSCEKDA